MQNRSSYCRILTPHTSRRSNTIHPYPTQKFPVSGVNISYIKPTIARPNIIAGDFTYFADADFESHVTHHYSFIGDKLNAATTYPFCIFGCWDHDTPHESQLPIKGDTVIGLNSTAASDIEPYCVYAGNPARLIRRRFDEELTGLLLRFKWWDKSIDEINSLIPILTTSGHEKLRKYLKTLL